MPENEQDQQVDTTETVPLSPEWGGVPVAGGDNADAIGGPASDAEPVAIEAEEATAPDADDGEQQQAETTEEAAEPVAIEADAPDADDGDGEQQQAETADEASGAHA